MGSYLSDRDCISIAVMGATGTGKTTFINLVSGSNLRVGDQLESCTTEVEVSMPFEVDGRLVELIDTPGFDDTTTSDADILNMIAVYLCESYREGKTLTGIIYMHRISDFRVGGIAVKNFRMFRQLCGDSALQNLVIVTNMWGEVSPEKGQEREQELANNVKFFKNARDKGANMCRHDNTMESALAILRGIMSKQPVLLGIQDEMVNQRKNIAQTRAAEELQREIIEEAEWQRVEIARYYEEAEAHARQMEENRKAEIEKECILVMQRMEEDRERQLMECRMEQLRIEQEIEESEEAHRREMESIQAQMPQAPLAIDIAKIVCDPHGSPGCMIM